MGSNNRDHLYPYLSSYNKFKLPHLVYKPSHLPHGDMMGTHHTPNAVQCMQNHIEINQNKKCLKQNLATNNLITNTFKKWHPPPPHRKLWFVNYWHIITSMTMLGGQFIFSFVLDTVFASMDPKIMKLLKHPI